MTRKSATFLVLTIFLIMGICTFAFAFGGGSNDPLPIGTQIDYIVVYKSQHKMDVYANGGVIKSYQIALGENPIGAKHFEGDKKTPEGSYFIDKKNPQSRYHKNLSISYPNEADLAYAAQYGKRPGSEIKIHGITNGLGHLGAKHRMVDWTQGCIALTNEEIDELYNAVSIGTPIDIYP